MKYIRVGPYTVAPTPTGQGIGADNSAFGRPYLPPIDSQYGPRYNVRGDLGPHAPAYVKLNQDLLPVDLLANGIYFAGTFAMMPLTGATKANNG